MRKEYAVNEQDKAKNMFSQSLDRFSVYLCENVSYIKIPLRARERSKGDTGVRPFPRIPLASIHLGWAMCAPPGKTLVGMIGQRPPGNWSRHHKTRDWEPHRAALLGSPALLLSPRAPFPIVSCLSARVSPQTFHFWASDKCPVWGPGKGSPFLQQNEIQQTSLGKPDLWIILNLNKITLRKCIRNLNDFSVSLVFVQWH